MKEVSEIPTLIEMRNVGKAFPGKSGMNTILDNISLIVKKGEMISLLGESGCGKSTLLNLVGGFLTPTEGQVFVANKPVQTPNKKAVMLFQDYGLLPWRTVLKNVEIGLESMSLSKKDREERARSYLKIVGLDQHRHQFPKQLSGGMKQRVAIARALAIQPELILMDEPFAALDAFNRYFLQDELLRIQEQAKTTILLVTHDIDEAVYLSDRIVILDKHPGRIKTIIPIELGRPRDRSHSDFQTYRRRIFESFSLTAKKADIDFTI
ncbi:ABC transporter ATP-binding protein [Shouchella clausii]|uniref:ABC transporter ATP-binding protein n=1 Tax=Shouchella clausii TaxID=79880 RepID=UPI000A9E3039